MRMMGECNYLLEVSRNKIFIHLDYISLPSSATQVRASIPYFCVWYPQSTLHSIWVVSGVALVMFRVVRRLCLSTCPFQTLFLSHVFQDAFLSQPRSSLSPNHQCQQVFELPVSFLVLVFRSLAFRVAFPRDRVVFEVFVLSCGVLGTFDRFPLKAF